MHTAHAREPQQDGGCRAGDRHCECARARGEYSRSAGLGTCPRSRLSAGVRTAGSTRIVVGEHHYDKEVNKKKTNKNVLDQISLSIVRSEDRDFLSGVADQAHVLVDCDDKLFSFFLSSIKKKENKIFARNEPLPRQRFGKSGGTFRPLPCP